METQQTKAYKERRLWYFVCKECTGRSQSHKRKRALERICRKCLRFKVPDNQLHLFGFPVLTDPELKPGVIEFNKA